MSAEQAARQTIEELLRCAAWHGRGIAAVDSRAIQGVAISEIPLADRFDHADFFLFADRTPSGAVEAKSRGVTLAAIEVGSASNARRLPGSLSGRQRRDSYPPPVPGSHRRTTHPSSGVMNHLNEPGKH